MKRYGMLAVLIAAVFAAGCIQQVPVRGSGNVVTETRDVSGFNAVALGGQGVLTITVGETEALTVTADDNLLEYIETKVEDERLTIGWTREAWRMDFRPSASIKYDLTVVDLEALAVSGSASVRAKALAAEDFNVAVNGSADIEIGNLETGTFSVAISGCGDVTVAGEADAVAIAISGSGVYRGGELASRSASCAISGSGDVTVWAEEELEVGVSGSGAVAYYGEPNVRQDISGSGSVRALGPRKVTL
jgi:hypothetical protein